MEVVFYQTVKTPVLEFIKTLDMKDKAKVLACLKSVEELGFDCPRVKFRQIRGKLWEIKINASKTSCRIFYVMVMKNIMVLLHAYKKQSQKAPIKEIAIAEKRLLEVCENEKNYAH